MARRRSRPSTSPPLPAALQHLVHVCKIECPTGHAEALSAFIRLALYKVPIRGIFDPGMREEPELYSAIDSVAEAHLDLVDARRTWRAALKAANLPLEKRDDIETAVLQMQTAFDTAYFYAGLAFGLAYSHLLQPTQRGG